MKFSVNWLRELVELPSDTDALADLLTMAGVEIEAIEKRGADIANVVVAQINESTQHPNADRLSVCVVDDGTNHARQIVCGAKNYKVGDKVPAALPGAELPNGLKIKVSKLRGVESQGMLCSAIELGLGEDAGGLLILSPEAKVGAPIGDLFPSDTIFDVEITPNRGDLLSHYGLAREIAALVGSSRCDDVGRRSAPSLPPTAGVHIHAPNECPFYSLRRIDNIKVGASPQWLRNKLESVGLRAINNVVDISNFVMLELGQPTHAFDAAKLNGDVQVRLARAGENLLALDGKTYHLKTNNLVIADREKPIGLGGVMGGEESGVSESTTSVLLESAYFSPSSIRKTARELNLPSDASYRFERGVDPGMILRASERVTELICEIAGGVAAATLEVAGEPPANVPDVKLRYERVDRVLGVHVAPNDAEQMLARFGLTKPNGAWKIPSYRRDLKREEDLIEELVRVVGIANIPSTDRSRFTPLSEADRAYDFEARLRDELAGFGLTEVRTSRLIARALIGSGFAERAAEVRNPLSEDHVALRPSLIPGMLDVVGRNTRAGAERIALFELGRVFDPATATEQRRLALALSGSLGGTRSWREGESRRFDLFDVKGVVDAVLAAAGDRGYRKTSHPSCALAVEILFNDRAIGFIGQLSRALSNQLDAPSGVYVVELNLDEIAHARVAAATFTDIDKFPSVTRDIAMIVPEELAHTEIMRVIFAEKGELLESAELFDLFAGGAENAVGEGRKSLAYSLTYRSKTKTLTSDEVNAAHSRIRERLRSDLSVELRE